MKIIAPELYKVMVENRDVYMARALDEIKEEEIVAVVGLAHINGIVDLMVNKMSYKKVEAHD